MLHAYHLSVLMVVETMYADLLAGLNRFLEAKNRLFYLSDLAFAGDAGARHNLRRMSLRQLHPALVSVMLFPASEPLKHSVGLWTADFALL